MQGVLLQKRNKKTGEINLFEEWTLRGRSENEPERSFYSFQFFDFDQNTIEELTLNEEEFKNLKLFGDSSNPEDSLPIEELQDFYSDLNSDEMKVIEVGTKEVNKGRYTIRTIASFQKIGTIAISK